MEGSHSPFGLIWQLAGATGWSVHYILWKVSYPLLLLMAADSPRYVSAKRKGKTPGKGRKALELFQTKLGQKG